MGVIKTGYGMSSRELHEICNRDNDSCVMYISGFFSGMEAALYLPIKRSKENITIGTLKNIFIKEMYLYPQLGDIDPSAVMTQLLIQQDVLKRIKKVT